MSIYVSGKRLASKLFNTDVRLWHAGSRCPAADADLVSPSA
jgi:hypothetical protein